MIKIAIAEDNNFLANSLINKLGLFDDVKIKFLGVDGEDLLRQLEIDSNVDVILMDIQMPNIDGIEATKEVVKMYPHIKVIMLTILDSEQAIYESIKSGATGYLVKESSPEEIHDGIMNLYNGGGSMSPSIAFKAMKIINDPEIINKETINVNLSKREKIVLAQLVKGLTSNKIAVNLFISPKTVQKHIENIYKKLDVHNKTEAIDKVNRFKII